jgi:Lar family restriction alleviation protein
MTEKLKPCPFCGSTSLYFPDKPVFDYFIHCDNCGCNTDSFTNAESAIEAWNRRAKEERS